MTKRIFPESKLAHRYLDGLIGIEIGASAQNPFGLNTQNVDMPNESGRSLYKRRELPISGEAVPVDIEAPGDALPLPDDSTDFVISSHVLELFPDPIKTLSEWYRVVKPGGYIYMIVSHRDRTFDRGRESTNLAELQARHAGTASAEPDPETGHCNFWITSDGIELVRSIGLDWSLVDFQDTDDKVGNGFTLVLRKGALTKEEEERINDKLLRHMEKETVLNESFFRPGSPVGRALALAGNSYREFMRSGPRGIWKRIQEFTRKK